MAAMQIAWLIIAGRKMVECIWICRGKGCRSSVSRAPICAFRMEACSNFINWTSNPEVAGASPVGIPFMADIAQLVEHLLVAQGVVGSNPTVRPI